MWLVVGTRPEAIKLGPVARALQHRGARPTLVLTGQQAVDPADYGLADFPTRELGCPGQKHPHAHVGAVAGALLSQLRSRPDLIVVQGDTSSAYGGALAAIRAEVPLAHVEAGLRTFDHRLPWPEEEYRCAIDARADLLFAPTELAARNLKAEQVRGSIHVTGNSGIDALLQVERTLPPRKLHERGRPQLLVTCHRRESWGLGLVSIAEALATLSSDGIDIELILHPNPHVAATMREALAQAPRISLIEPLGHRELILRMRDADLILSDSGGIQEEAPALGTPLLVLREKTERPEGVATGNIGLVGTSTERIVSEVRRLLGDPVELARMSRRALPYGDGRAGPRIAEIVTAWCAQRAAAAAPGALKQAGGW